MRIPTGGGAAICLALLPLLATASGRERRRFDDNWQFCLGGAPTGAEPTDESAWRPVHLPNDYVVEGGFDRHGDSSHGFRPKPVGWYRRRFAISVRPDRRYWLEFDGVYRDSTVSLNGHVIGGHRSGYTSFCFDVTPYLNSRGDNLLAVRVDPTHNEGWWYEGGGIYRHVWLTAVPAVHVAHWGTYVTTPTLGTVNAEVRLDNETAQPADVTLECAVERGRETLKTVKTQVTVPAGGQVVRQQFAVARPRLWSPEAPNLYHVVTRVKRGRADLDSVDTPFGFRTVAFDSNQGFILNGRPYKLKGAAIHQDFAAVGTAITDNLQALRVERLKSMGDNAIRCAHNPPAPELLDACDRQGMLVIDENRHPGDTFEWKTPAKTTTNDMSEVDSMVLRDRNHPSIFAWSLCNEEWNLQSSADGVRILGAVARRVKELDPTRPTTLAMAGGAPTGKGPSLRDTADVTGANYNPQSYDPFHREFPDKPLMATEFSAQCKTRGIYAYDPEHGYFTSMPEQMTGDFAWMMPEDAAWSPIGSRPFVAGGFIWSGFDYRGEPTPYRWPYKWPDVICPMGEMDLCGFPKDGYYYFQSVWGPQDRPIVHILPHWNWPESVGQTKKVCVYANADEVQLSLNGKPLVPPRPVPAMGHAEWIVPYAPGRLVAQGYRNGRPFGRDDVATTGPATAISLKCDAGQASRDPGDLICVTVEMRDAVGRRVPTACNQLQFSVSGPASIVGAGNGDTSDHEPEATGSLTATTFSYKTFNGLALVLLRPSGRPGPIVITAQESGLATGAASIEVR
jgi:beta-galactosidase